MLPGWIGVGGLKVGGREDRQPSRPGEGSRWITDKVVFILVVRNQSQGSRLDKGRRSETSWEIPHYR